MVLVLCLSVFVVVVIFKNKLDDGVKVGFLGEISFLRGIQ